MAMKADKHHFMARRAWFIRLVLWLMLISAMGVTVCSGYGLWEIRKVYVQCNQSYERLQELVRQTESNADEGETEVADILPQTPQVEVPDISIDFDTLRQVNADAAAWLYCPDTPIDYPVMSANDYNWYLYHLPDGTYNANGSLFLDYNGPMDFSGDLSIIYGHNMKSDRMFGSLTDYKSQAYFEQHPYIYLYTPEGSYRVDLIYGCVVSAGEWRDRAFMFDINLDALLSYAEYNTTFESGLSRTEGDRVLALSTCSYEFDDARYVVLGLLRPEYGTVSGTVKP